MPKLIIHANPQAMWYQIISEAQYHTDVKLPLELEYYLALMLNEMSKEPSLLAEPVAERYLVAQHNSGCLQQTQLKRIGDECLIIAGLFPQRAEHRHVDIGYYHDIGKTAYHRLHHIFKAQQIVTNTYKQLVKYFESISRMIQAMHHVVAYS
jgi:hypothetical protein